MSRRCPRCHSTYRLDPLQPLCLNCQADAWRATFLTDDQDTRQDDQT